MKSTAVYLGSETSQPSRRRFIRTTAAVATPALLPAAVSAQSTPTTTLTLWSWVPKLQRQIDLFEKANPTIKVQLVNVGQGLTQHLKLRNALKAGTGAPDVAHIEYYMLPSFRLANALVDLAPYGANDLKADYIPWAWSQVSDGAKVFAMPWDSGPIGLIYRKDILERHQIKVPVTWDEFAAAAARLKQASPDTFLTNTAFAHGAWSNAVLWQGGSRPFEVDGTTIRIAINDAPAKRVAAYWQKLIDEKLVDTKPMYTTEWYASLDQGRYASWIAAVWGPLFLTQFVKSSSGNWRASAIPQWRAGDTASANWGGSTMAVISQSKHPREAAKLAMFLMHDSEAATLFVKDQFLFPVLNRLLADPEFANGTNPFYGDQPLNKVFIESARHVDPGYRWSPFQDYVFAQMASELGAAAGGKGTLVQALDRLQDTLVKYARDQGFTVRA